MRNIFRSSLTAAVCCSGFEPWMAPRKTPLNKYFHGIPDAMCTRIAIPVAAEDAV